MRLLNSLISVPIFRCSPEILEKELVEFIEKNKMYKESKMYSIMLDKFEKTTDNFNDIIAWINIVFLVDHFRLISYELKRKRYHRNITNKIFMLNSNYSIIESIEGKTNKQLQESIFRHIEDFKKKEYKKHYLDKQTVIKKLNCIDIIKFVKYDLLY